MQNYWRPGRWPHIGGTAIAHQQSVYTLTCRKKHYGDPTVRPVAAHAIWAATFDTTYTLD